MLIRDLMVVREIKFLVRRLVLLYYSINIVLDVKAKKNSVEFFRFVLYIIFDFFLSCFMSFVFCLFFILII